MKSLFASILLFSSVVFAQAQTPPPNAEEHRWLYNILFSESDRNSQPSESFKSFYVHMLDSDQFFPQPEEIQSKNLKPAKKVEGFITYVNIIQKKYNYDVVQTEDGTYVMNVRIHLKDPVGDDFKNFKEKIQQAEDFWNASRVPMDFKYAFKFELVETEEQSLYSVNVFDKTRGPYDRNWGRDWTGIVIAHEIGHMMGIADEYQTLSGKVDCLRSSLMCMSWQGALMKHHYYFILRRLIQPAS